MELLSEIFGFHTILHFKIADLSFNVIQFTFCLSQFKSRQFVEGLVDNLALIALLKKGFKGSQLAYRVVLCFHCLSLISFLEISYAESRHIISHRKTLPTIQ
jgi:predicted signal transduction protein with EAL and GGDEF domain